MFKLNNKEEFGQIVTLVIIFAGLLLLTGASADKHRRSDDIILAKGKLIMRGGKGKGNIILDTGGKSHHEQHMSMMPMMGHHFNPYSFYPMNHHNQHQEQPPMLHIQPIYLDDHSAMHHEPEFKQHEYHHHHEEPQHHHSYPEHHHIPEHHEHQEHQEHHEPMHQHHEMHHHQIESYPQHHEPEHHYEHHEHHEQPEHYEHHEHHEPHHGEEMMPHHYMQETQAHQAGYELASHPLMSLMMHGSGLHPITYGRFGQHLMPPQMPMIQQSIALPLTQNNMKSNQQTVAAAGSSSKAAKSS